MLECSHAWSISRYAWRRSPRAGVAIISWRPSRQRGRKLAESGETAAACDRRLQNFVAWAEKAAPHLPRAGDEPGSNGSTWSMTTSVPALDWSLASTMARRPVCCSAAAAGIDWSLSRILRGIGRAFLKRRAQREQGAQAGPHPLRLAGRWTRWGSSSSSKVTTTVRSRRLVNESSCHLADTRRPMALGKWLGVEHRWPMVHVETGTVITTYFRWFDEAHLPPAVSR